MVALVSHYSASSCWTAESQAPRMGGDAESHAGTESTHPTRESEQTVFEQYILSYFYLRADQLVSLHGFITMSQLRSVIP